jgi:hypothetical protein
MKPKSDSNNTAGAIAQERLVRDGWAVIIFRDDGTHFFSASNEGIETPLWAKHQRKRAVAHKRDLMAEGFNAKVVRVEWTPPVIIPNA